MRDGTNAPGPPPRRTRVKLGRVLALTLLPAIAEGAVLRDAVFDVVFTSSSHCQVAASFAIDDAVRIEHQLVVREGATPTLTSVDGSVTMDGAPVIDGRAPLLRLRGNAPGDQRYRLRYEVEQASAEYRCPLWLPTIPSDGRSQNVTIRVSLPSGVERTGGSLPAFAWEGDHGTARVNHVPAFVRVPFGTAGAPAGAAGLDITRLMDVIAIVVLAGGMVVFAWRQRRR